MMHEEVAEFPAIQGFLHTRLFGLELSKIASPRPIPSQPVTNPPFLKNNRGPVTRLKPLANTWRIMAQTLQRPGRQTIIIANDLIHKWLANRRSCSAISSASLPSASATARETRSIIAEQSALNRLRNK